MGAPDATPSTAAATGRRRPHLWQRADEARAPSDPGVGRSDAAGRGTRDVRRLAKTRRQPSEIEHRDDPRVLDPGARPGLLQEALHHVEVRHVRRVQDLERDVAIQIEIARGEDQAERAHPQLLAELVLADPAARGQHDRHLLGRRDHVRP